MFGKKKRTKKAVYEENLIVLENVTKSYQSGNGAHALNGVNLKIKKGEFVFEPQFNEAGCFNKNGLACVKIGGESHYEGLYYINSTGKIILPR